MGLGFRVQGSGFRVQGSGLWWQLRCKIYICGGAATFIPNSQFLILNSSKAFKRNQRGNTPHGLTLKFESKNDWLGIRD